MRGFRTPALMVSPRARRGHVAHDVYDHTSVLKMIEWRWGLDAADAARRRGPQHRRGARLRVRRPNLAAPRWSVPPAVSVPCGPEGTADYTGLAGPEALAAAHGWRVGGVV